MFLINQFNSTYAFVWNCFPWNLPALWFIFKKFIANLKSGKGYCSFNKHFSYWGWASFYKNHLHFFLTTILHLVYFSIIYLAFFSLIWSSSLYIKEISTFHTMWIASIFPKIVVYLSPLFMSSFKAEIFYDYINFCDFLDLCQNGIFLNVNKTFMF